MLGIRSPNTQRAYDGSEAHSLHHLQLCHELITTSLISLELSIEQTNKTLKNIACVTF